MAEKVLSIPAHRPGGVLPKAGGLNLTQSEMCQWPPPTTFLDLSGQDGEYLAGLTLDWALNILYRPFLFLVLRIVSIEHVHTHENNVRNTQTVQSVHGYAVYLCMLPLASCHVSKL